MFFANKYPGFLVRKLMPAILNAKRQKTRPDPISLAFVLFVLCAPAWGDIYVLTDEAGNQSFSDQPTDPRYTLFMRTDDSVPSANLHVPIGQKYSASINRAAKASLIDAALLHAVIATESHYDPRAVSNKGAQGLMQLMPGTARRYGVSDPFNPEQNVMAGARYLQSLLARFNNNLPLALAAYNAGENTVIRYQEKIPPYPETIAYVAKVMGLYHSFGAVH